MRTLQKTLQKFGGKGQIFPNTLTNSMKNIQIFTDDCESLKFHTNFSFISYADFNQISMNMSQAKEPFILLPFQLSENIEYNIFPVNSLKLYIFVWNTVLTLVN